MVIYQVIWDWIKKWFQGFEAMPVPPTDPAATSTPIINNPVITVEQPKPQLPMTTINPDALPFSFDTANLAYHAVRVLCDLAGLNLIPLEGYPGLTAKDLICSCVYQESEFLNYESSGVPTQHRNLNKDGSLSSTDWGIVQVNDYFHIAPTGSPFASVSEVMNDPEAAVNWMINCYKAGELSMWDSYLTGAYQQWLVPTSPMWALAS